MDRNEHDQQHWALPEDRAEPHEFLASLPQDHGAGRRPTHDQQSRANGPRRPDNRERFEAYMTEVLVPELQGGDIVITDNLSSHKRPAVQETTEAAGATLRFLAPLSPAFNPAKRRAPASRE